MQARTATRLLIVIVSGDVILLLLARSLVYYVDAVLAVVIG